MCIPTLAQTQSYFNAIGCGLYPVTDDFWKDECPRGRWELCPLDRGQHRSAPYNSLAGLWRDWASEAAVHIRFERQMDEVARRYLAATHAEKRLIDMWIDTWDRTNHPWQSEFERIEREVELSPCVMSRGWRKAQAERFRAGEQCVLCRPVFDSHLVRVAAQQLRQCMRQHRSFQVPRPRL
jgi:hypothetical protein